MWVSKDKKKYIEKSLLGFWSKWFDIERLGWDLKFLRLKNCLKVGTLLSIIKSRRWWIGICPQPGTPPCLPPPLKHCLAIILVVVIKGRVILIKQLQGKCCSLLGYHLCPFPTCKLLCALSPADPNMSSEMKHWRCTFFKSVDHILRCTALILSKPYKNTMPCSKVYFLGQSTCVTLDSLGYLKVEENTLFWW